MASALTLRSGTQINLEDKFGREQLENFSQSTTYEELENQYEIDEHAELAKEKKMNEGSTSQHTNGEKLFAKAKVASPPVADEVRPTPPFPQWLKKHNDKNQFRKFVYVLDSCISMRKVERIEIVAMITECCSTMSKLPPNQKDTGSFVILCFIGDRYIGRALSDLGSSVNLMPKSIFLKLGMCSA
ncbi:uncharacterized protein LOC120142885 [Hibiscus syriacus]|uniref:uncharacterized protein LOC120142885 n=1 Tax=Hibiscus syriacus TaxID=106335 RepID=UPI00192053DB|nr:uncharacterized protein LOC120142885 [Hibiscus syriacus]